MKKVNFVSFQVSDGGWGFHVRGNTNSSLQLGYRSGSVRKKTGRVETSLKYPPQQVRGHPAHKWSMKQLLWSLDGYKQISASPYSLSTIQWKDFWLVLHFLLTTHCEVQIQMGKIFSWSRNISIYCILRVFFSERNMPKSMLSYNFNLPRRVLLNTKDTNNKWNAVMLFLIPNP